METIPFAEASVFLTRERKREENSDTPWNKIIEAECRTYLEAYCADVLGMGVVGETYTMSTGKLSGRKVRGFVLKCPKDEWFIRRAIDLVGGEHKTTQTNKGNWIQVWIPIN